MDNNYIFVENLYFFLCIFVKNNIKRYASSEKPKIAPLKRFQALFVFFLVAG